MARAKSIDDDVLLDRLAEVFRTYGYEGANLGRISAATGLQRASLYHRFPGGKMAMAEAVLDRTAEQVVREVVAPLREPGTPRERLDAMAREIDRFYSGGRLSCLLDSLSFSDADEGLRQRVEAAASTWVARLVELLESTGQDPQQARERSIDAIIRVQGALVFARVTGDTEPFARHLRALPESLLEDVNT